MSRFSRFLPSLVTTIISLTLACSEDPVDPSPAGPRFISATASANPNNAISSIVTVKAELWDSAFIRFWATGIAEERTPSFTFAGDSTVLPVLGLHQSTAYSLEINLVAGDSIAQVDTVAFTSGALPSWIPPAVALGTDTSPGYLVLSYPDGPVIINNLGRVVWYRNFPGGVLNSFQVHFNGAMTLQSVTDPATQHHILNALGNDIGSYTCLNLPTRFHDVMIMAGGDRWMLCDEFRDMDLTAVGGLDSVHVQGTVIQHISADGQELLFEWKALDHFQITDLPLIKRTGTDVNFTHGNGIAFDTDGKLLLSSRSLDEVTKIDPVTGQVVWRLGGLANQFSFVNDPKNGFQQQHGVRPAAPGQIQMLDNGTVAPSRLVKYHIDPIAMTAVMLYEFVDAPTTFTSVGGSTQYYATSGRSLVSFGREGRVVEVDPVGNKLWELTGIDDVYVFRAQRIQSLYTPGIGELTR